MPNRKLLKVDKDQFEKVLKNIIAKNGYNVQYSYTSNYFYLSGDELTINQLQMYNNQAPSA